ncbi:2-polyprenyl-6-hydroxyphenyl methylase / 3-demethylubiquinone-9 3-methyltransferase [Mucilaginibacter pineti]|uniref:2-polyprenyl-6-hydroxyphenyl methylase / 3-demethylubiquinone-9 3-methyltransferase n=1 Tax=Mucilaginibacter pineti TaxID=1391627 RepID=A0A1G6UME8_9SPHI|nr:class I SAM-dependent methyltransferase [Mucilaginibacter pineti]SDD41886.1 2-polyprenyl-6-hydroxyphenyl methylase / 3-demethylubiquinone-9 3-methyltransferase [Mucilaginibacter pineti]
MADYKDYGFHEAGPTHNLNYQLNELTGLLNKHANKFILDLGCGNGYLVNHLIEKGYNAYGTDASEKGIAIAQKQNVERFFVQDLSSEALPVQLQNITFDTIISTEVIEHLYNPEAFINFCRQQLPNGGEIIITTPYHGYLKNLLLSLLNKWDSHMNPLWLGGHIKLWSKTTLSKILRNAGFTIIEFKGCGRIPYLWKSMIIKAKLN